MDKTKAKIQELVPHKKWRYTCDHCQCGTIIMEKPTLADVLLAIGKVRLENITLINLECNGNFVVTEFPNNRTEKRIGAKWDLTKSYDDQSQETKDFIGQILGVK